MAEQLKNGWGIQLVQCNPEAQNPKLIKKTVFRRWTWDLWTSRDSGWAVWSNLISFGVLFFYVPGCSSCSGECRSSVLPWSSRNILWTTKASTDFAFLDKLNLRRPSARPVQCRALIICFVLILHTHTHTQSKRYTPARLWREVSCRSC